MKITRATATTTQWEEWSVKFWTRVEKLDGENACWVWRGSCIRTGYGMFWPSGKYGGLAHRFAWADAHGSDVPDKLEVVHSCDNPTCCRPDHLSVATHLQNMRDSSSRRRASCRTRARGEGVRHVLTREDVVAIKKALLAGETRPVLAERFGVTPSTIRLIDVGINWAWLNADGTEVSVPDTEARRGVGVLPARCQTVLLRLKEASQAANNALEQGENPPPEFVALHAVVQELLAHETRAGLLRPMARGT